MTRTWEPYPPPYALMHVLMVNTLPLEDDDNDSTNMEFDEDVDDDDSTNMWSHMLLFDIMRMKMKIRDI